MSFSQIREFCRTGIRVRPSRLLCSCGSHLLRAVVPGARVRFCPCCSAGLS